MDEHHRRILSDKGHEVPMELTWDQFRFYSQSDFLFAGESDVSTNTSRIKAPQVNFILDNLTWLEAFAPQTAQFSAFDQPRQITRLQVRIGNFKPGDDELQRVLVTKTL